MTRRDALNPEQQAARDAALPAIELAELALERLVWALVALDDPDEREAAADELKQLTGALHVVAAEHGVELPALHQAFDAATRVAQSRVLARLGAGRTTGSA